MVSCLGVGASETQKALKAVAPLIRNSRIGTATDRDHRHSAGKIWRGRECGEGVLLCGPQGADVPHRVLGDVLFACGALGENELDWATALKGQRQRLKSSSSSSSIGNRNRRPGRASSASAFDSGQGRLPHPRPAWVERGSSAARRFGPSAASSKRPRAATFTRANAANTANGSAPVAY